MVNKTLLKPKEVASFFGVTLQTVYNWIWENKLNAVKIGSILRIPRFPFRSGYRKERI